MENNVVKRKVLFNKFVKALSKNKKINLVKTNLLGRGYQGVVYKYCDKELCTAVKKMYLENRQVRYLKKPYTIQALKYENFIEIASMKLTNELVLQKICPNFILNYHSEYTPRDGICNDIYPYSSKYYNEYIDNVELYTEWVKKTHTISQWYNAYFQITIAIFCLQRHFNMIHLDLHSDNVLVRYVKPGGYWKYTINNVNYYVPNLGYIFYINDFGHAWIPSNFQSWIVRKKYKTKRVHKNFDIVKLFESTLQFSKSPINFKNKIRYMIKQLEGDSNFINIIDEIWEDYKHIDKYKYKRIETYDLDKKVDVKNIPKDLRHLVLRAKSEDFT
jgi:hypothetical protein